MAKEDDWSILSNDELDKQVADKYRPAEFKPAVEMYTGPERRLVKDRRIHQDRREMIRFEMDKPDRRKGKLRRQIELNKSDMWQRRDE